MQFFFIFAVLFLLAASQLISWSLGFRFSPHLRKHFGGALWTETLDIKINYLFL